MNPREFCQEREYPLTLALSYSFDPLFFDRVVLRTLWGGGAEDVLVLADADEVDRALARAHGPIHHLGRRYLLVAVRAPGRFHPKMILRLGKEDGLVAVGSGNLTHGGWGLNCEVAAAWRLGPGLDDTGSWIPGLLERVVGWAGSPLATRAVERMQDVAWIERGGTDRLLVSGPTALATQLEERWAGRRFTHLRFATGSTDTEGAVLRWLHEAFGVDHAVGCITPSQCALRPERAKTLPLRLELVPHLAPITHAKIYHLSGPDGEVLLMGSANCSSAAWLRPPAASGNVEMLLVYEAPARETLAVLDDLLGDPARSPDDVLLGGSDEEEESRYDKPQLNLATLQVEEDGSLVARVSPELVGSWCCRAIVADQSIPLRRRGDGWTGRAPEVLPAGQTAFGSVEARNDDGRELTTGRRWVDDLRLLLESGSARAIGRALGQLPRPRSHREDDQLLQDLARLAHDLIHDAHAVPDPCAGRTTTKDGKDLPQSHSARPVDPAQLIRSLREEPLPLTHSNTGSEVTSSSLSGIFRALFGAHAEPDEGYEISPEEEEAAQAGNDEEPPRERAERPELTVTVPVDKRNRDRFERHLDGFIGGLKTPSFREGCTATQLVQAIGYPFAAAALGVERGWTDPVRARLWLVEAAALLLYGGGGGEQPLLQQVEQRYASDGSDDLFRRIVGDGTLWVTMLVGLARVRWPDQRGVFQHLLLIRDLWKTEILQGRAEPDHVESLVRRYRAGDAIRAISDLAAPVVASLEAVEEDLAAFVEGDPRALQATSPVAPDELLWGPRNGWAISLDAESGGKARVYWFDKGREAKMQLTGHFLSMRQAARWNDELQAALEKLSSWFRTPPSSC